MKIITWRELKELIEDNEVLINCETNKDSVDLLLRLEELGYKWADGASLLSHNAYETYGCEVCYRVNDLGTVSYHTLNYRDPSEELYKYEGGNKSSITKTDLSTGDLVEMRNGAILKVFRGTELGDMLHDKDGHWESLNIYCDDLSHEIFINLDIVGVYRAMQPQYVPSYDISKFRMIFDGNTQVKYISGVTFGSENSFVWKSAGVNCEVGDIVEVETSEGIKFAKVIEVFFGDDADGFRDVLRRVNVNG